MTYLAHIPKTIHAQRHQTFLAIRAEARRSLSNCEVMHGTLVRAEDGLLSRNYVDVSGIKKLGRQIVKISQVMRELRPVALQPDPPRHEAVSAEMCPLEQRTYGGIKASRLMRVLNFIRGLRRGKGEAVAARRVLKMSDRLINGLDIYKRVKALVGKLSEAVDAPDTAITPRPQVKRETHKPRFKWEVSPQKVYGWTQIYRGKGYDPRQTSVYWLEKQAVTLKRAVYQEYHGIERAGLRGRQNTDKISIQTRIYVPPKGAQTTDQIWPPIDLVRMIETRRADSSRNANTPLHPSPELVSQDDENTIKAVGPNSTMLTFDAKTQFQNQDLTENEIPETPLINPD